MTVLSPTPEPPRNRPRRMSGSRASTAIFSGSLLLVSLGLLAGVLGVPYASEGRQQVVAAGLDGISWAAVLMLFAAVAAFVLACVVPAPRWWLLLFVPLRIALFVAAGAFALGLTFVLGVVTPLVAGGCQTGYVVSERTFLTAASGEVLRSEGLVAETVAHLSLDDANTPFWSGDYIAVDDGTEVKVWHTFRGAGDTLSIDDAPNVVLPHLADAGAGSCGLDGGRPPATTTPKPSPTPMPTPTPRPTDDRDEVARMIGLTLAAANPPVRGSDGGPVSAPAAGDLGCVDGVTSARFDLATGDNAGSLARILAVWDAEGYLSDRAMQEDLRSSETSSVRLSARDRTTIDGLLHLDVSGVCPAA